VINSGVNVAFTERERREMWESDAGFALSIATPITVVTESHYLLL
jgi:hypothetical protein